MLRFLKAILFFVALSVSFNSWATHARGGEITYQYLGNKYKFIITLCNDEDGSQAAIDVNPIEIRVTADNLKGQAFRVSKVFTVGNFQETIFEIFSDEFIDDNGTPNDTSDDKTVFLGNGTYVITATILDRNAGILNINGGNSEMAICLESMLIIGDQATGGFNNSVYFENQICPEIACAGQPYCFNPLAVDPDGDSLVYSLVTPKGEECFPIASYSAPNVIGGGNISIDSGTGTICWNNPQTAGDFVFSVKVEEYRGGILVGYVVRDIQLTIFGNCTNLPPVLDPIPDTCIVAGESFSFDVTATDPDGNSLSLTATSLAFESGPPLNLNPPATFTQTSTTSPATGIFSWDTNCSHLPKNTYNYVVTIEATEMGTAVPLSSYQTFYVRVIPPHVKNINATALGEEATITWNAAECPDVLAYKIYRHVGPPPTSDDCCETGAALSLGYHHIGTVENINNRTFTDKDLQIGAEYCYTVTAIYQGGVESCPIEYDCIEIIKDVPVMTHVTVNVTGGTGVGVDSIQWSRPTDLDLATFPGPYFYRLYVAAGDNNANTLIYTTPQQATLPDLDTTHIHTIDTESQTNSYRVELWWNNSGSEQLIGSSQNASSIFLSTEPNDNEVKLTWEENVPWENYLYEVYRADNFTGPFVLIGSTTEQEYTDTGLINGVEYCYKILGFGEYDMTSVIRPLLNWSQIKCEIPWDFTAPCPPELIIESDCVNGVNALTWTNPNNYCADDVTHYNIYYAQFEGDSLQLITSINSGDDSNANDTTFTYSFLPSVAGCYAITALDSLKFNGGNESVYSNIVCVDNCPIYELPNVFSPGTDGKNDIFHPLYPYRNVESVNFTVFNRWGQVVFHTTDPELGWNGTHKDNGELVPDGTYYYVCEVNFIRLAGIIPLEPPLTGFITIFKEKK